ncbi:hypothetical protein GCM10010252_56590 [Streptomyces aureoverticillatus]|nr:hypothetical protein GCM10010252_56590 [Streptomyces aureoverticillatus]
MVGPDQGGQGRVWLRRRIRRAMGTSPNPVAAVIDSQSVKVAATVPRATSGYDAGKRRRAGRDT